MDNHCDKARTYFLEGYNCAQSVLLAYHEELGLDPAAAARLASPFGGGMGRLRAVCGAVSGMLLAAGMYYGYDDPKDYAAKKELYARVQKLVHTFADHNGSYVCRELLGLDHREDCPDPSARTEEYYQKRPCADLVADAAGILEDMLKEAD